MQSGTDKELFRILDHIDNDGKNIHRRDCPKKGVFLPYICEVCGIHIQKGNHTICQKIKQKRRLNSEA